MKARRKSSTGGLEHFDEYYPLYQKARELEKSGQYEEAINIYVTILDKYAPAATDYYERPAILLERIGRFAEAAAICKRLLARHREHGEFGAETAQDFTKRLNRLNRKLGRPEAASAPPAPATPVPTPEDIDFPEWHVSLSFGESRSPNYPQAVALAKMAPQYREERFGEGLLHQAVYSDKPDEYLQFIKLYELVGNWKSVFVIINGQVVDRKIIGGLNHCYGDRCRSGNPDFCFGASPFTENPFGCHRLQVSAYNNPWWSFGYMDGRVWRVDKAAILERLTQYSQPYRLCPAFSWDRVLKALDELPDTINPSAPQWTVLGGKPHPVRLRLEVVRLDNAP